MTPDGQGRESHRNCGGTCINKRVDSYKSPYEILERNVMDRISQTSVLIISLSRRELISNGLEKYFLES